ncbi:hypothetical protein F5879DRAFT_813783, partial [Lentinula edodes]
KLAIGEKVLVTQNIETDLDFSNGARGKIVEIVFDPREPEFEENCSVVELEYMPLYMLVKMDRTRAQKLDGLEEQIIPMEPHSQTVNIQVQVGRKKHIKCTVHHKQFPMTAAYAFTDYQAQGLVDIGKPPTGTLSLFNL